DEGSQALAAVAVVGNPGANPFGTGWWGLPSLFFFLQATSIQFFGDSVAGVRVVSGLLGALAVGGTYLLARRLFGRTVAVLATALLAVFPYHLLFSRLASIQVVDTLALVAALLFLDLGFRQRQPTACLAAGLAVGLGQYGSFAGRLLSLVAAPYLVYVLGRGVGPAPSTPWR